jgi:hypothetical protein
MANSAENQTGKDGFWVNNAVIDVHRFYSQFDTSIYIIGITVNKLFQGIGFQSEQEHEGGPVYFFTKLRNHKGVGLPFKILGRDCVNESVMEKWFDGVYKFTSDVFVKVFRRTVTSAAERVAWAECWKRTVLIVGDDALCSTTIMSRHLFVHREDIEDVQTRLFDSLDKPVTISGFENNPFSKYVVDEYKLLELNPRRVCSFCSWSNGGKMKTCPCKTGVHYCSAKCQSVHWRMCHKKEHGK